MRKYGTTNMSYRYKMQGNDVACKIDKNMWTGKEIEKKKDSNAKQNNVTKRKKETPTDEQKNV